MKSAVVIFSDDFRIKDNPALFNATLGGDKIIPLFVYDENYLGRKLGSASKVFLYNVLKSFSAILEKKYSVNLIIRKGNLIEEIKKINKIVEFDSIYFNRSYSRAQIDLESQIAKNFLEKKIYSYKAKVIFEPHEIKNKNNESYKVFTYFFKECLKNLNLIGEVLPEPKKINSIKNIQSLSLDDLDLIPPNQGKWPVNIVNDWSFDYYEIEKNANKFLEKKIESYNNDRNYLSLDATSKLSPYFRFGMMSPRLIFCAAQNYKNSYQFLSEIGWREFAYNAAYYNQNIHQEELKDPYKNFQWENNKAFLKKWQYFATGFDIIDAAMAELYYTGTMHNRARMIVASFLIKDLLVDWRLGEQWFWDCLFDADWAVNPFSWQWVFGSGYDAAPYFRIFNPHLQSEKFDKDKIYIKKWLKDKGKTIPIVDHDQRKKITLEIYKKTLR